MEARMRITYQLSAITAAIGLSAIALALLNADKIGEGLTVSVVVLTVVRYCARRCADACLTKIYPEHGDRMD
jgi:hypothetical protein